MFSTLKNDIRAVFARDPAAKSVLEILLCYPGLHAVWVYRLSHWFYRHNRMVIARLISHVGRFLTGIEIHPGAVIGKGFFIDHGMGVVIGETCEIGKNVTLYQGVTLGGTGKEKGKRHPTIGDNVVVATGAKVLGSFRVGNGSRIGAGSVVLKEVPDHSTVVGIPGKVVAYQGRKVDNDEIDLEHDDLPDPEMEMLLCMQRTIVRLEERIRKLEEEKKHGSQSI